MKVLSPKSYFRQYLIHPLANDLSKKEKVLATALTAIISVASFFTVPTYFLIAEYLKSKEIKATKAADKKLEKMAKVHGAVKPIFDFKTEDKLGGLTRSGLSSKLQATMIDRYYSQPLPHKKDVLVPVAETANGETQYTWKEWVSLTRKQKIAVNNRFAHPHTRVSRFTPEYIVDALFFTGTHHDAEHRFLPADPRRHHGGDHCVRASLFAAAFAYLYVKYHPDYDTLSQSDLLLSQYAAAGHDCARATEGTDVYDMESAERTVNALREAGVTDPEWLTKCREALENKDAPPNSSKSLVAKCLQNADCADFARLLLNGAKQSPSSFENSRKYLDIYKELEQLSTERGTLKNGLTFEDFVDELDTLRSEMNSYIFQTHSKQARRAFSTSDNYYKAMLKQLSRTKFPRLTDILSTVDVIPKTRAESPALTNVKRWLERGTHFLTDEQLQKLKRSLESDPFIKEEDKTTTLSKIVEELEKRNKALETFENAGELNRLEAFDALPPILKDTKRNMISSHIPEEKLTTLPALRADQQHKQLKQLLNQQNISPEELQDNALKAIGLYAQTPDELKDPRIQTSAALAIDRAVQMYIDNKAYKPARKLLKAAEDAMVIHDSSPLSHLSQLFEEETSHLFFTSDCGFLERRRMRLSKKIIDGKEQYEIVMTLPPHIRGRLKSRLKLLKGDPSVTYMKKSARYLRKKADRSYTRTKTFSVGKDHQFHFPDLGEITIGAERKLFTQYQTVRIRIDGDKSAQDLHRLFCKIGLPMAMQPSRDEDIRGDALNRLLLFYHPQLVYENPGTPPDQLLEALGSEDRTRIESALEKMTASFVGIDQPELVNTSAPKEAFEAGAHGLMSFIKAGDFQGTAQVFATILQSGLLSSQERFHQGLLGTGCCPTWNFETGSANQVFTRPLTENLFQQRLSLDTFAINGPIMLLIDIQAYERMPYTYLKNRAGLLNPYLRQIAYKGQKQKTEYLITGEKWLREHENGIDSLKKLNTEELLPLRETMFNTALHPRYITGAVVRTEKERQALISFLKNQGIFKINDVPIEDAIIATNHLSESIKQLLPEPAADLESNSHYL